MKNPSVKAFWENEFPELTKRNEGEVLGPILNKVGEFMTATPMRNILGQKNNAVDFKWVMDENRIFIANISKGKIGDENSNLLGSLLVSQFRLAAFRRAETLERIYDEHGDLPKKELQKILDREAPEFRLYIDEFQNFGTDAFESILSEARKYRLALTIGHQYISQLGRGNLELGRKLKGAIFGNVGSLIVFRVGHADANVLEEELPELSAQSIIELGAHQARARILLDGEEKAPVLIKTLPPLGTNYGRRDILIRHCRERFGTPKHIVEERFDAWLRNTTGTPGRSGGRKSARERRKSSR